LGSTSDEAADFQVLGPGFPWSAQKRGGHGRRIEQDLGVQVQVAFAVKVGVTETQAPGPVRVGAGLFHIAQVAGGHLAAGVDVDDYDGPGLGDQGRCLALARALEPLHGTRVTQAAGHDSAAAAGVGNALGLAAAGHGLAVFVFARLAGLKLETVRAVLARIDGVTLKARGFLRFCGSLRRGLALWRGLDFGC